MIKNVLPFTILCFFSSIFCGYINFSMKKVYIFFSTFLEWLFLSVFLATMWISQKLRINVKFLPSVALPTSNCFWPFLTSKTKQKVIFDFKGKQHGVNFINVFIQKSFRQLFYSYMQVEKSCMKHFRTKNVHVKCCWNWHKDLLRHFCSAKAFTFSKRKNSFRNTSMDQKDMKWRMFLKIILDCAKLSSVNKELNFSKCCIKIGLLKNILFKSNKRLIKARKSSKLMEVISYIR